MTDRPRPRPNHRPRKPRRPTPPTKIELSKEDAGARIRAAMEAAGRSRAAPLSAAEAAERLGISAGRVYHVLNGRKVLTWPRLLHWIAALDLDPRIVLPELFAEGE